MSTSTRIFCTLQELKEFLDTTELTIDNLSKFIENKTNQEYLIVPRDFVEDLSKQLLDNTSCIFDMNRVFHEVWGKIIRTNLNTANKWKDILKAF